MDALALLCTLHADGPATLKRLRARGYSNLVALIERSATDLSADLEVEPAFARRLLREAKLLAVRVGAEGLEAEEAPPIETAPGSESGALPGSGSVSGARPSIPIAAPAADESASTLDAADLSLVERIVATPKGESSTDAVKPEDLEPQPEPVSEPEPEPCALEAASLPGLDADLIFDLKASGISTLKELADADSLTLTRALGVTFAQARRLGFLARRAAGADVRQPAMTARRTTVRKRPEVVLPEVTLAPHRRPAATEDAAQDAAPPKDIARLSGGVGAPVEAPEALEAPEAETPEKRKPFWEPREFLTDAVEDKEAPQQGVKVDPSEIAPRPRFGDRLAQAAQTERQRTSHTGPAKADAATPSGTVLGWNFEIPRPEDEPSLPLGSLAVPDENQEIEKASSAAATDQDRGGPFA